MYKREIFSRILKYAGVLKCLRLFSGSEKFRVLMYHRVFDKGDDFPYFLEGVPVAEFDKQMGFLAKNFNVIAIEDAVNLLLAGRPMPKKAISVTIDDGYVDCYTNIFPVLRKYCLPATIYLTTGHMGSSKIFWADEVGYIFKKGTPRDSYYHNAMLGRLNAGLARKDPRLLDATVQRLKALNDDVKIEIIADLAKFFQVDVKEPRESYNLTWAQVKEMSDQGIFFGAHTLTHPILTRVNLGDAEHEVSESKATIESHTGKPVHGFCYPNGTESDFNDDIIGILKKHGFRYAVTTIWGFNHIGSDRFKLNRVGPNCDDDIDRFECIVSGGFEIANKARKFLGSV